MIDIFSKNLRSQLPWAAKMKLMASLARGTLASKASVDASERKSRIEELVSVEREHGFVFFAEKLWLEDETEKSYVDWVAERMSELDLFKRGLVGEKEVYGAGNRWRWTGEVDILSIPKVDSELSRFFSKTNQKVVSYYIFTREDHLADQASAIARAFHILFHLDHYATITFESCYFKEAEDSQVDSARVWQEGIDEDEIDSLMVWIQAITFLECPPTSQFWQLSMGESLCGEEVIFFEHEISGDPIWKNFDHETMDRYTANGTSMDGHKIDPERLFWC